ncbi:MAG: hypothetical protein LUG16_03540, partial [Candidatus Gastranaerophilales bacterium]|nr:hypothetical protein [Candidatus Gastranaerophilales bacterium]
IIVPALCCDKNGYRIGYGKGFYDRFFKQNGSKQKRIILCFSDLIENNICPDSFDEKCDIIITESSIYKCKC